MHYATRFKSKHLHEQAVKKIRASLQAGKTAYTLKPNAASNALRNKKGGNYLDLSSFRGILELNATEQWIVVEPRITFKELCAFTLRYHLIPPVVPEFTSITVGGAIMGAALESSSHRYGQVSDCTLEYELLLGNGQKITASKEENQDLFYGISGSYGTLALMTAVKLKLIPAKKWVHVHIEPFSELKPMVEALTQKHTDEFVEGIVLNANKGFILRGNQSVSASGQILRQKHAWSPWYVQYLSQTKQPEFSIPLQEYLFRLDRGAFWMGRYVNSFSTLTRTLLHLGTPKVKHHSIRSNWLFRFLFGWTLSSERLYKIWHRIPTDVTKNLFFIHDFYTPATKAVETFEHFVAQTDIFPIWLCPIKGTDKPQFLSPHYKNSYLLNIGLYGIPRNTSSIPDLTTQLERDILKFGGRKMLYSFTYYDEETFSKIYHQTEYTALRKKFYAENAFPTLYNKLRMC